MKYTLLSFSALFAAGSVILAVNGRWGQVVVGTCIAGVYLFLSRGDE